MESLLLNLKPLLPSVSFEPGNTFFWSPEQSKITYRHDADDTSDQSLWSLLHEASHALLGHQTYRKDVELLLLEVAAWSKAKELGQRFKIIIDESHIQDCLDTYRDWLHQRATCPRCSTVSTQLDARQYKCHNCIATWHVSSSRFCRPYRSKGNDSRGLLAHEKLPAFK